MNIANVDILIYFVRNVHLLFELLKYAVNFGEMEILHLSYLPNVKEVSSIEKIFLLPFIIVFIHVCKLFYLHFHF